MPDVNVHNILNPIKYLMLDDFQNPNNFTTTLLHAMGQLTGQGFSIKGLEEKTQGKQEEAICPRGTIKGN